MSDEEYVLKAQSGDDSACEYILNKYKPMVRSVSRTYFLLGGDRDDIVQEGMIGLYKAVCAYDPHDEAGFQTYAGICVRRQIYSAIKAASRHKHMPLNDYISLNSSDESSVDGSAEGRDFFAAQLMNPEDIVINREQIDILHGEIDGKLSKFEKAVLAQYMSGRTYDEIAAKLGKNTKAIDNALQRIKRKLKEAEA